MHQLHQRRCLPFLTLSLRISGTGWCWWMLLRGDDTSAKSQTEIVDYYVGILESVIGSEMDMFHVVLGMAFVVMLMKRHCAASQICPGFCLFNLITILALWRRIIACQMKIFGTVNAVGSSIKFFPNENTKHWLVRVAKPTVRVVMKAQMVDHFVQLLTKIMGNETDAQMCLYHVSWQYDFGFCCELAEECAKELAGEDLSNSLESSSADVKENINTKKLFVTGLSFYTSEKTLRAAFEDFGELVEVKIIWTRFPRGPKDMHFYSTEYTTVEAAGAAFREMNGKDNIQPRSIQCKDFGPQYVSNL